MSYYGAVSSLKENIVNQNNSKRSDIFQTLNWNQTKMFKNFDAFSDAAFHALSHGVIHLDPSAIFRKWS